LGLATCFSLRTSDALAEPGQRSKPNVASSLGAALRFEPNRGQSDRLVRYLSRGSGYAVFLTPTGATLEFDDRRPMLAANAQARRVGAHVLSVRVVGARAVEPTAEQRQAGFSNYFVGSEPTDWRTGIEGYAKVRYAAVLPGVDILYYGTGQRRLEYDVVLAANTDPKSVTLAFDRVDSLAIRKDGALVLSLPDGAEVVQPPPVAYQTDDAGRRVKVTAGYALRAEGVGFTVGPHDSRRPLVLDPALDYGTYWGGAGNDNAYAVALDAQGDAYVAGTTLSSNFPGNSGPQTVYHGGYDSFVTKFDVNGSPVFSTYLGGSGDDDALAIAVDGAGNAYVAGGTTSANFPAVSPFQPNLASVGSFDCFVTKITPNGFAVVYSTYLGGAAQDVVLGIAVDVAGAAYLTGYTTSTDFPGAAAGLQSANGGADDAFVAKLNPSGTALSYSTYFGGSGIDYGFGIAVSSASEAYVAGLTKSQNLPTRAAFQAALAGGQDAFVARFNAAGSASVFATYLGGNADDEARGVALDTAGSVYVVGYTSSSNFPTASAMQASNGGGQDGFVTKLSAAGTALSYSTYIGGSGTDQANGIAISSNGEALVAGLTTSTNFPTASGLQNTLSGFSDAFVSRLGRTGALGYSSYFGGSGGEEAKGIAVDSKGDAYVVGSTSSTNLSTALPAQPNNAGSLDAFAAKMTLPPSVTSSAAPALSVFGPLLFVLLLALGAWWTVRQRSTAS